MAEEVTQRKEWGVAADIRKLISDDAGNLSSIRAVPFFGSVLVFGVWAYVCVRKAELYHFEAILAFLSSLWLFKAGQKWGENRNPG